MESGELMLGIFNIISQNSYKCLNRQKTFSSQLSTLNSQLSTLNFKQPDFTCRNKKEEYFIKKGRPENTSGAAFLYINAIFYILIFIRSINEYPQKLFPRFDPRNSGGHGNGFRRVVGFDEDNYRAGEYFFEEVDVFRFVIK